MIVFPRAARNGTHKGNDFGWLCDEFVCQLLVEADEVLDVNIAVEFLEQRVFFQLVSALRR